MKAQFTLLFQEVQHVVWGAMETTDEGQDDFCKTLTNLRVINGDACCEASWRVYKASSALEQSFEDVERLMHEEVPLCKPDSIGGLDQDVVDRETLDPLQRLLKRRIQVFSLLVDAREKAMLDYRKSCDAVLSEEGWIDFDLALYDGPNELSQVSNIIIEDTTA
jgi:hypothetical protein